ncbi:aminomethyl-transferring glycine dehydrogenase [Candidatus Endowatersipora endosymbiont of Watersipora subatra]|uniref:aminomethyl-transferring glycine dehydrogenase n=1 Tax=Candidatus Endowatersipora endosymbiont of Watersipora subatra TaxID=3077946 RepID=UPI00312CBD2B
MTVSPFLDRHIGPKSLEQSVMLNALNVTSLEALISQTIPESIRFKGSLNIPHGISEEEALAEIESKLRKNLVAKAMIGQGYHGTHVPPVIRRNLFENPGWYTAYTPYQPEISQGRLEMLFHFQTLISELTGLPVANASLLDEATAVSEAASLAFRYYRGNRSRVVVANSIHSQTLSVLKTRSETAEYSVDHGTIDDNVAAVVLQMPDTFGSLDDPSEIVSQAQSVGSLVIVSADPLSLVLLQSPGNWGADICVGSMQRFGVPMGNGGPHPAYFATTDILTRLIPGRIIGQSIDSHGRVAYRLALQTREQHIRREKATSNICTSQALLANMVSAYAIWHGPSGLKEIANRVHRMASRFASSLKEEGIKIPRHFFDVVTFSVPGRSKEFAKVAEMDGILLRVIDQDTISVAFDETIKEGDLHCLCRIFNLRISKISEDKLLSHRSSEKFLTQKIFHSYRSETEMMRFLRTLMDKDLALDRTMIPLGSCTMKLNSAVEMMPISWDVTANIHPFSPENHRIGYQEMIHDLDIWLSEITGFSKISFQPNAGSQGEYAGLLAIRSYHRSLGEVNRDICLIPSSAHGTNPASARMAGYDVVVIKCRKNGNIDMDDLRDKAVYHSERLAALMITYPSTHGVFESSIKVICSIIHENGGQVYLDGANLNAMIGLARPADLGSDVCHMNLHKTFCIPHGGGGPGVGPIGVAKHLLPFLPSNGAEGNLSERGSYAVSANFEGSASILSISWMYIRMLGAEGLKRASEVALLNANYIAQKLSNHYPVLFRGDYGRCAHECIIDVRVLKSLAGVTVDHVAKRLIDYGFHAPTMSWPVSGTLMVEPTESEPLLELDRFIHAMIAIADEARRVADGEWPQDDNPICNAPHTSEDLMVDNWHHPYPRSLAAYPNGVRSDKKYWPPVSCVDNLYGDRNLVCTCIPIEG